jgi:precorrin-2 dehydrogenase/sirohydrochlorin ferrochelatase
VAAFFPLFLKLKKRKCLMVGAGEIGEGKIAGLLAADAHVHVVAPTATKRIRKWAREGKVRWLHREFRDSDLADCLLVVAATSSSKLHKRISRLARRRGVLCNVVDVPELCDFYYPAVVRRGALQIAVSTSGESPALAQRLRTRLEKEFGPEYGAWLRQLGKTRKKLSCMFRDLSERKTKLHEIASEESFQAFLQRHSMVPGKRKR